jgi:hypothetical protein
MLDSASHHDIRRMIDAARASERVGAIGVPPAM